MSHHPPCTCGCGELADECAGPKPNPLGSMSISPDPHRFDGDGELCAVCWVHKDLHA